MEVRPFGTKVKMDPQECTHSRSHTLMYDGPDGRIYKCDDCGLLTDGDGQAVTQTQEIPY